MASAISVSHPQRPFGTNLSIDGYTSTRFRWSEDMAALKPVYGRENRFRPCPHTNVVRQVDPADRAGRINKEFGGSCNVLTAFAAVRMQHSVLTDSVGVGV